MIIVHEKVVTEWYFFLLSGSNGADKMNLYLILPVYNLIST